MVSGVDWFESIQQIAQEQAIGIWSVENYVTDRGYDKEAVEDFNAPVEKKPSKSNADCTIKGNINSKGEKIYHTPGQQWQ